MTVPVVIVAPVVVMTPMVVVTPVVSPVPMVMTVTAVVIPVTMTKTATMLEMTVMAAMMATMETTSAVSGFCCRQAGSAKNQSDQQQISQSFHPGRSLNEGFGWKGRKNCLYAGAKPTHFQERRSTPTVTDDGRFCSESARKPSTADFRVPMRFLTGRKSRKSC